MERTYEKDTVLALVEEGKADIKIRDLIEIVGIDYFTNIVLDAMHTRLAKGYKEPPSVWRNFAQIVNVPDFRTQNIVRPKDFTTLDKVGETQPYADVSFTDEKATFSLVKWGNTFALSLELRAQDTLGALGNIMQRFGSAAARTLEKYVMYTNWDQNPTIYDSAALFVNATHANSLGATKPLTTANLDAAVKALMVQTDPSGNSIDLTPRFLVVHPTYAAAAQRLVGAQLVNIYDTGSGVSSGGEPNIYKGAFDVVVSAWLSSNSGATWYLTADSSQCEMFTMGFLNGREEPELFQESPGTGYEFEYDAIRFKCRIIFGGAWGDYRGVVRANVAD